MASGAANELSFLRKKTKVQTQILIESIQQIQDAFVEENKDSIISISTVQQAFSSMNKLINSFELQTDGLLDNCFDRLPKELLHLIFSFIPSITELLQLSRVCKRFQSEALDNTLLRKLCYQWWEAEGFNEKFMPLDLVYNEAKRDWLWFSKCISANHKQNDNSWNLTGQSYDLQLAIGKLKAGILNGWGISVLAGAPIEEGCSVAVGTFQGGE